MWGPSVGVRSRCYCQYIFNKKEGRRQFSRCWRKVKPAAASATAVFVKGWKPKSDTVSGSKRQHRETEIPPKKKVLLAITLTALRCFQVPRNTESSDIATTVPTWWKIKVIIRKEGGVDGLEEMFFSLYFDIFLPWRLHTKGSF